MNNAEISRKLQALYIQDDYRKLFEWLGSHYKTSRRETAIEKIEQGLDIAYYQATKMAKTLAEIGCGKYKKGRDGKNSHTKARIIWMYSIKDIVAAAKGVSESLTPLNAEDDIQPSNDVRQGMNGESDLLQWSFPYRSGIEPANLSLKKDITAAEAERLANFIRNIPFAA